MRPPDKIRPCPRAIAVGRHLERKPPPGYQDRYSAFGWAVLVEAVWSAEAELEGVGDWPACVGNGSATPRDSHASA